MFFLIVLDPLRHKSVAFNTLNIINKSLHMTKLRFLKPSIKLETSKYFDSLPGSQALKTLKTRLNMLPVYGNFKGDVSKPRLCQYCEMEDDTTEHLLSCRTLETNLTKDGLFDEGNSSLWIQINEIIDFNLNHRV